jgi:glycosyltransferase involved in cell wall biosynthesis
MRQIIVNDTLGSVAPSNDPSLLAEHISSALSRKKEKAYRVKRRSAAAAFSWTVIANRILNEYLTIINTATVP